MLARGLSFFAAHASLMLAFGAVAGLTMPELAAALRGLLTPSVFLLLFLALLRIDWSRFSHLSRQPASILLGGLWLMLGAPVVVWLMAHSLGLNPSFAGAMAFAAGAPPLMASPAFAVFLGLDATLAIVVLLLATLSAPVTIAFLDELLYLAHGINSLQLMISLALIIAGAAGAALVTRQIIGPSRLAAHAKPISGVSIVALVVLCIASMDGVLARLVADPRHGLWLLGGAFALNIVLQIVTGLIFFWTGRMRALTIAFCGGNRNVALLLTVMPASAHPDFTLFFALAQLPMYLLPVLAQPIYRRLVGVAIAESGDQADGPAKLPEGRVGAGAVAQPGLTLDVIEARLGWRRDDRAATLHPVQAAAEK